MKHLFLIDGSGFIFRAFHALPPMTRSDGTPVNAVYGFATMVMKLVQDTDADHVAVIFDKARTSFRMRLYPEYKAHRPDPPEELVPQFALIREAAEAFGLASVEREDYEADDLIATYARLGREKGMEVTIVSSDKDLMQLIRPGVSLYDAMKNKVIGEPECREKFGVGPEKVVDVQALAGDATDNVPGVPGIGVKTAAQLIEEYGDLETLLARASEIKQPKRREALIANAELARISKKLVTLDDHAPAPAAIESFAKKPPDWDALGRFLKAMEFKSLLARIGIKPAAQSAFQGTAQGASAPSQSAAPAEVSAPAKAEPDYELVQDGARLDAWIERARAAGRVAFDTETDSLDALNAKLVGFSLAIEPHRACYVPLGHVGPQGQGNLFGDAAPEEAPKQIPLAEALAKLKPLLEDPSVLKIGHNIKYDMQVMAGRGIVIAPHDDTMLISYVLGCGAHNHNMDDLAARHLGHNTIKFDEVTGTGKARITFDRVPLDKACAYAAEDADVTLRLHDALKPDLLAKRLMTVYETLERPLVPVIVAMERAGIKVDAAALRALSEDFAKRLLVLEGEIHKLAGREFNIASPKQLGEILFEDMSLPGGKKSAKTGAWSTGAEVLEELAAQGQDLPARVLDWRQLAKLKSTYTDALLERIDPNTKRVHTSFSLAATSTGRLASSEPNLQNIPIRTEEGRKIRRAFVAEKGHALLSADYSQIELRLVAHVAEIEGLKEAFRQGIDIHAVTASQVFGVPIEGMDPMVRRKAKAINFGIIYGISAFGLANQLGIPQGEAAAYIDAYFQRYPEIKRYMESTKEQARKQGYVVTLFGRRCHTPGIADKNPAMRAFAERAAINAPIQGGAADIIKRAMIRMPDALAEAGLKARMLLQVHDELVFEAPEGEAEKTRDIVKRVMESAAALSVPLEVEVGIGAHWGEAH